MAFLKRSTSAQDPHAVIQACLQKRDYKGALGAFETLLKRPSSGSQLRMRYADTLVLAGRKADAIREYTTVAEDLAETGYLVKAVAVYKKIVKLDPGQSEVVARLARLDAQRQPGAAPPDAVTSGALDASSGGSIPLALDMEEDDGSSMDLDIGSGLAPASAAPGDVDATFAPDSVESDLDAAQDLSVDDLASAVDAGHELASGAGIGTSALGGAELSADDLSSDDLAAEDLASDAMEVDDLTAREAPAEAPASPAVEPAPAGAAPRESGAPPAGLGFDFGAPAAAPSADAPPPPPAGSGLGFSFGAPEPAPAEPAPAAERPAGLDFSFGAGPATPPADMSGAPAAGFGLGAGPDPGDGEAELPFGGGAASPSGEPGEDLLNLLGDDIDSLLDGIMTDVEGDEQHGGQAAPPAETNIALFSHLAIDEFIEVLKALDRRTVRKGETIVREGDEGRSMFIITGGAVEASIDRDGQRRTVATLRDGEFFGEMAVLSGEPRTATVTAIEGTELLVLEHDRLHELFSRFPEIEAKLRLSQAERAEKLRGGA